MHRRFFLKSGGLAFATLGLSPQFLSRTALGTESVEPHGGPSGKTLVCLFQRGGADALNMVIPHGEPAYYALRPMIAIPRPCTGDHATAIDLDGFFGLHPKLAPLRPLWHRNLVAAVHAVASPDRMRSHLDAQKLLETGTADVNATTDGWLNRVLGATRPAHVRSPDAGRRSDVRAISATPLMPRILAGREPAFALTHLAGAAVGDTTAQPSGPHAVGRMHDAASAPSEAAQLIGSLDPARYEPSPGAEYPHSEFGQGLRRIAQLIKAGVGLEVAFADMPGWDTHVHQGGATGYLADRLDDFACSVAAFVADLEDRMEDVVILTMSEFGRTARENRSGGTDHGHAGALFVIGGPVKGGKVYGTWPGLEPEQLRDGRDLAYTTDVRAVFSEVVARHLGATRIRDIFPGYAGRQEDWLNLL